MSSERGYAGASAATRKEPRSFACNCGERFGITVLRAVDARQDPDVATAFVAGRENRARCPACGAACEVQVSVVYHDPAAERLVLVLPDALRHAELEERGRLYLRLADDGEPPPRYVREFQVVFGLDELRARLAGETAPVARPIAAQAPAPIVDVAPVVNVAPPRPAEPIAAPPIEAPSAPVAEASPTTPAGAVDQTPTRIKPSPPDPRTAAIDRWVANREGPSALLCGDQVVMCVALPRGEMRPFLTPPLELRLQLHRLPAYPIIAVTVVGPGQAGASSRAVHALLEIGRAAHRAIIEQLARASAVSLQLFDAGYAHVLTHELKAPLEENVRRLFGEAKEALQAIAPATRSFDAARAAFLGAGHDRVGGTDPILVAAQAERLDGPRHVRAAVAEIAALSDPEAERHLIEIRSFPVETWRAARRAVVRRALDFGIHCRRSLVETVLRESGVHAGWTDVLRRQVAAFHDVSTGKRPNDLPIEEEADNWRLLVEECLVAGVGMDPAVRAVAEARQLAATPAAAPAPSDADLDALSTAQLIAKLDKDARREVALELCERRELAVLLPLFTALPRMTRADVNRVLPAIVVAFGGKAEARLIEALRSRKSYIRQGAALGLGAIGSAVGTTAIVEQLAEEPTEVWRELARALGDVGAPAVPPLLNRLRQSWSEGPTDGQAVIAERVVRALAHVASRGARGAVEKLAAGTEPALREIGRRALLLVDEVRRGDAEVRGGQAPRDQTVVRAFSRRFFDALAGSQHELSDDDLEEMPDGEEPSAVHGHGHGARAMLLPTAPDEPPPVAPERTVRVAIPGLGEPDEPMLLDDEDLVEEPPRHGRATIRPGVVPVPVAPSRDSTDPRMILPREQDR